VELLLLTPDPAPSSVLPALARLPHRVQTAAPELTAPQVATPHDAALVDARRNESSAPAAYAGCCAAPDRTCP